ncbi:uncharacterized protein LOC129720211 [Wyeomyia smithii]|uniref:uncharacterized protein LOC129720211 n=1 Tax=Wyeomyia smithii TaxID=174621 RepID=UPI002467B0B9|nr:uncharacterized protein LOC129720211 [Wyeomyia smithii]
MDYLAGLKRYRILQPADLNAEAVYQNSVKRIDVFNSYMGYAMFKRKISLLNFPFMWGICSLPIFLYLVIETAYWYRQDIEKALMSITTFGFGIQMASKVYTFVLKRKRIIDVHDMNMGYFNVDSMGSLEVQKSLSKNSSLTYILISIILTGYIILVGVVAAAPALYGLVASDPLLPLGFEIIHSDSWIAYWINYSIQLSMCYYAAMLTTTSDATFILYILTSTGHIDAIIGLLDELGDMASQQVDENQISEHLTKILQVHQYHFHYMRKIEDLFKVYFLIAIASLWACITISLAAFVLINWYIGAVVVCFASCQIFFMCFLGTHMQLKSEELMLKVGSFAWYTLPLRDQKRAILFLAATQSPITLSAIMARLDVAAYLKIHKAVYSMLMVLLQVKI